MNKFFAIPLALILLASPVSRLKADTSDGLIIGGFAGLTAGLIGSAIASNCSKPAVVYYEEPVYVERPVFVEDPRINQKRAELAWREENLRQAEIRQANQDAARRCAAQEEQRRLSAARAQARRPQSRVIEKTVVETRTMAAPDTDTKKQELAIKQQQLELEMIKAKTELLQEENKKKELALKEQSQKLKERGNTITKTVSTSVVKA